MQLIRMLMNIAFFIILKICDLIIAILKLFIGEEKDDGEDALAKVMSQLNGIYLRNLLVPISDNMKTEIDGVFIAPSGVFVIEDKLYNGTIHGNEEKKDWTQEYYDGSQKELYNPIMQNRGHVQAIYEQIKDLPVTNPLYTIYSLITFSNRTTIDIVGTYDDYTICKHKKVKKMIENHHKNIVSAGRELLSEDDIAIIAKQLKQWQNYTEEDMLIHIEKVNERKRA